MGAPQHPVWDPPASAGENLGLQLHSRHALIHLDHPAKCPILHRRTRAQVMAKHFNFFTNGQFDAAHCITAPPGRRPRPRPGGP